MAPSRHKPVADGGAQTWGEGRDGDDENERRRYCHPTHGRQGSKESSGSAVHFFVEHSAGGARDVRRRRILDIAPELVQLSLEFSIWHLPPFAISIRRLLSARESRDLTVPRAQPSMA